MRNIYLRYAILILVAVTLFISYEYQVQKYIHDVINPILLIRTFHSVLFVSIFWIFWKKNDFIYKHIEMLVTLLIFNAAIYFATPLHHIFHESVIEASKIPELAAYLGKDLLSLINNRYFGYSTCFLFCLGVLRVVFFNFLNSILIQLMMDSTEYIYTCKCCNGIVNKSEIK